MSWKSFKYTVSFVVIVALALTLLVFRSENSLHAADELVPPKETEKPAAVTPAPTTNTKSELPDENSFKLAAQTDKLRLLVDNTTGHFKVEDKRNGNVWRSYPNPDQWSLETITGTWRNNLRSPIMLEYIDMANFKSQPKTVSFVEDKGIIEGFQSTPTGFKLTYNFNTSQFKVPVEVKITDDYVETNIIDSEITEGKLSILNIKLFPFFGAEPSVGQEGYMLIPDGSGALIKFDPDKKNDKSIYREAMYGADIAFFIENTSRQKARMPIFGMKSGNKAFLAVMDGGEEYSKVFASPAGSFGISNWISNEMNYRIKFYQKTSKKKQTGFYTYSKQRFQADKRTVKYFLMDTAKSDYVGMASRYREFLMKDKGLKVLTATSNKVPMFIDIIGADVKKGKLWDKYLKGTSTSEAMQMVKRLYGLGIENMSINYLGWQNDGYSALGGLLPVDKRLGGNEGMKQFIQYAHSINIPVFLGVNYTVNNNGRDSFKDRYDGMRDLSGTVLKFDYYFLNRSITLVSPKVTAKYVERDLPQYKALGVDGLLYEDGLGRYLDSDFNKDYPANRTDVMKIYQQLIQKTKDTLGGVQVDGGNFFTLGGLSHLHRMPDDYSYDLFVDNSVPFAQIAIHGLVSYTSEWSNMRDKYKNELLRSVEYGSDPTFVFTNATAQEMQNAYSVWYYSMDYHDWESTVVEEYQKVNEALGDVQNKFIIGHKTLAPNVNETTYEGGKRVIVNYNLEPYTNGTIRVPAQDFVVVKGGGGK